MQADSWSVTLDRALAIEGVVGNAETIVKSPGSTIVPPSTGARGRISQYLEDLAASTHGNVDAKLRIEGLLGEGGMGVVRLAEQRSLGRKVALKSLKAEGRDDAAIEKLLHEAWITGLVEHPSVVPIHDIIIDAQGHPAIVLKRIEGQPWEALMFDAKTVKRRFSADDLLDWNLQVLVQVANAVASAHSRGIIHRDLKPDNIMVGEFGEVYLVDWGLAVAIDPDADPRLPRLREVEPMAGTPCYMAPEMLGGRGAPIGRATDVYLLGAVLFEIVTGMPPHTGSTLEEIIGCIVASHIRLPDDVPPELARIIRRAMDGDPHARFENATQVRIAIQGFLRHQGSRRLSEEADTRHAMIQATLGAYTEGQKVDEATLQGTYAECRFGYQQSLRAWPENEAAKISLESLVVKVVEFELSRGQPRVASAMIAGHEDVLPDLAERVERAVHAKDVELAKLEALGRELDPETGRRTRSFLSLIVGSLWTTAPLLRRIPALAEMGEDVALVVLPIGFMAVGLVLFLWARESMLKTAINRFLTAFMGIVLFTQMLFGWAGISLAIDPVVTYRLVFIHWALAAATVALIAQWRMFIPAFGYLVGFFVLMRFPEYRWWASSLCHAVTTITAFVIWTPAIGAAKVLDKIDPNRNAAMATYRVPRDVLREKDRP